MSILLKRVKFVVGSRRIDPRGLVFGSPGSHFTFGRMRAFGVGKS